MSFPSTNFLDLQNAVIDKSRLDIDQDLERVKNWINSAYFTACIETEFYDSSSVSVVLSPDDTRVAIPAGVVKLDYISPSGSDAQLWGTMLQVDLVEILDLRAWQGGVIRSGAPSRFAYMSGPASFIEIYPQAVGGEVLNFYGQFLPAAMIGDADTPIIPEPYLKVVEYGALIHAAEFQKDLLMIQQHQQSYQDWLQRLRGFNNTKVGAKVQQFRIEGTRLIPARNDVDTGY